jgi:hypothetical protein
MSPKITLSSIYRSGIGITERVRTLGRCRTKNDRTAAAMEDQKSRRTVHHIVRLETSRMLQPQSHCGYFLLSLASRTSMHPEGNSLYRRLLGMLLLCCTAEWPRGLAVNVTLEKMVVQDPELVLN